MLIQFNQHFKSNKMKTFKTSIFIVTCITLFCTNISLDAQLSLGLTYSTVQSKAVPASRILGTSEGRLAYEFGFMSETTDKAMGVTFYKSFTKLFFNLDVTYRETTSKYMIKDFNEEFDPNPIYINETKKIIHIPVIAGYNYRNFKCGVGTFFNYYIDSDDSLAKAFPFENKNRKLDTGMIFFLGYKLLNRVMLHARYEKAFVNVGNHIYHNQLSTKIGSTMNNVSFGISIYPGGLD